MMGTSDLSPDKQFSPENIKKAAVRHPYLEFAEETILTE